MIFTEKYYGIKLHYIPDTYDLAIIREQKGYADLFNNMEGKTLFELGGNKGYTSAYALTRGIKKIVSFEPEPQNIEYYKANAVATGADVTLYEGMADTKNGTAPFYLNMGINKGLHSRVKRRGREEITVNTYDWWSILEESRAELLKIDIEGGEYFLDLETRKIPDFVQRIAIEIDWSQWGDAKYPYDGKPYAIYKTIKEQFPNILKDTSRNWTQHNWSIMFIGER